MKQIFYIVIISVLAIGLVASLIYINTQKNNIQETKNNIQEIPTGEKGVVYGNIGMYQGNCMPSSYPPDRNGSCNARKVQANVYITKPTEKYEDSLLVSSDVTDEKGYFELELEPGDYSFFVYDNLPGWDQWNECGDRTTCDDNGAYACRSFSCPGGGKCICMPFTIEVGRRTEVNANIDRAAW